MNNKFLAFILLVFYLLMYNKILFENIALLNETNFLNFSNVYLLPYKTNIAPF